MIFWKLIEATVLSLDVTNRTFLNVLLYWSLENDGALKTFVESLWANPSAYLEKNIISGPDP